MVRIIAADSSAAVLDEKFEPQTIVAAASVLVTPPYRESSSCLAEPIFVDARDGQEVIVHEAELCRDLIAKTKADVVHLDMSLGSLTVEQLSPIEFANMKISVGARRHLLNVLPRLRKIANENRLNNCLMSFQKTRDAGYVTPSVNSSQNCMKTALYTAT